MENFDLNAYGVEEITKQEEVEVNGGGWFIPALLWQMAMEIVDGTFFSDIEKGRQEAKNALS